MSKEQSLIQDIIRRFKRKHNYIPISTNDAWRQLTEAFVDMERNEIYAELMPYRQSAGSKRQKYESHIAGSMDEAAAYLVMLSIYIASRRSRNIESVIKYMLEYEETTEIIEGKVFRSYDFLEEE